MTHACDLIACARQFIGVRFAHQGRTPEGLDCLGLLIITAQRSGLVIAGQNATTLDVPHYGTRPDVQLLKHKLDTHLWPIQKLDVCEGDVVLLKIDGVPQQSRNQAPAQEALRTDEP
jgi:hypothetical protein